MIINRKVLFVAVMLITEKLFINVLLLGATRLRGSNLLLPLFQKFDWKSLLSL